MITKLTATYAELQVTSEERWDNEGGHLSATIIDSTAA